MLEPEDLEKLVPAESRGIQLTRFVAPEVLGDQWYERPYYLGRMGTRRVTSRSGKRLRKPT